MKQVSISFKIAQGIFCLICAIIHIYGFLQYDEPLPHQMFFCGTFFGFILISAFVTALTFMDVETPPKLELVLNIVAASLFIISSLVSMHHAEKDLHLLYLSDEEESNHRYFVVNKTQSLLSLFGGLTYVLNAVFTVDELIITECPTPTPSISTKSFSASFYDFEAVQPIRLQLFCIPMFKYFRKAFDCKSTADISEDILLIEV